MKSSKIHEFTLVLRDVDENTPNIEDSLYEAGCDDALINFINGIVYLEFEREANSLQEAVISAIKDIKAASVDAEVASVAPENLVTASEIAKRLDKSRQQISLWIKGERGRGYSSFPQPVMRLTEKSPLWNWSEVVTWLFNNKIIRDKGLIEEALFFANINAALEERDKKTRDLRHNLLEQIAH